MIAILAEDKSDVEVLEAIVRKVINAEKLTIKGQGYQGCPNLCKKGARDIKKWLGQGIQKFIVCHDADTVDPDIIRKKVLDRIVRPAKAEQISCIVVPVQEIEAWLIADEDAINKVIKSFRFKGYGKPELLNGPKEWLVRESRQTNSKPLYVPRTHNPHVARQLSIPKVRKKCPSFNSFIKCLERLSQDH